MPEDPTIFRSGLLTQDGSKCSDSEVTISSMKKERLSMFQVLKTKKTEMFKCGTSTMD